MNQKKILEVNVDDKGLGGVYALVKNVIMNTPGNITIDIAAWEMFENPDNIEILKQYGCTTYYIGYHGNKFLKQLYCLNNIIKLIKKEKYEYVHIHSDVANKMLIAAIAAKAAGVPHIILHSHASDVDGTHRKMKRIIHKMCRRFLKYVGTDLISCSDLASSWMFPNVPIDAVKQIRNGVNLNKFRFDPVIRKKQRQILRVENKLVIGHVGRFAYQKNHEYLINIFEDVQKKIPDAILLLIGEGPLLKNIKSLCEKKNILASVIFYGTSDTVNDLMQAMDVFLLPSHFEGLPIVGVEAQASGLPVIFSDKITKEAALTKDAAYLPVGEKDLSLWSAKIAEFAKNKRKDTFCELEKSGFTLENTIMDFLNLYDQVTNDIYSNT